MNISHTQSFCVNEPELIAKNGQRPADWRYNDYIAERKADCNAVLA